MSDTISRITDQPYLRQTQYKTSANLDARINLHRRFSTNPYGWPKWAFDQLPLKPGMPPEGGLRPVEY